ncbi:hypothetical protein BGZ94_007752 [Podila epigama]|nr:hypothetical protein BGZ94_007752 [Podila epigama]
MNNLPRSDQSLTQGQGQAQGPDSSAGDAALQQMTTERNSLRSQNDQLWKIIEKQRIIIQNLQKDVAKAVTERDLLRNLAVEHGLQLNGHPIQPASKRSMERKPHSQSQSQSQTQAQAPTQAQGQHPRATIPQHSQSQPNLSLQHQQQQQQQQQQQESDAASTTSDISLNQQEKDARQAMTSSHSTSSVSSITTVNTDTRRSLDQQHPQSPTRLRQETAAVPHTQQPTTAENGVHTETATESEIELVVATDDDNSSLASYDPEVQVATAASRVHQQGPVTSASLSPNDSDVRAAVPLRTELTPPTNGKITLPIS